MSIKLEYSTTAQCKPESVWQAFTEVDRWPEWSDLFAKASWVEGDPWQLGSKLLLEVGQPAAKVKATVSESAAPNRATWSGNVMGVTIEHRFEFLPEPEGTLMQSKIELSGPATFFINGDMQKKGLEMFSNWFDSMKAQAEKLGAKSSAIV
jgi:Polyketide cyclase / dehydrase and lipid transport